MFCQKCNYLLDHLHSESCPECGQPFDPQKPDTYLNSPKPSHWQLYRLWYWRVTKLSICIIIISWENILAEVSLLITLGTIITLYALLTLLIDAPFLGLRWCLLMSNRPKQPPV
ncbi:hypothetical protein [Poriferisphaera sp. WC338]|uniref:hypothetical protein n=1 Tax=Poriferisphaera sp. WC338 TaxID=3425129 RepID=UPI003D8176A0